MNAQVQLKKQSATDQEVDQECKASKTGAEIFIESLQNQGVEIIFGYPGGAVLPLYDALYRNPIKHILARHEQGAIHAAEGYA
ncbi:MAG TPA: thiamine pyrophosphate-binding protein, partial [Rummeliibacillus sp.]|nr:thiamine pyrophosphate-binding protein [Rummeliibacillus sp.]